ncbi:hypothetical protein EVAR_51895_1 [Eumeta japonica]|uniref:Uncharacterized protein n=1 Tax=Eumeta variegata TaxID=151549 RepID=A0A4C1XK16_EUMVA|nr:hypothetical protein EVAR_51895_1 [Eumeta japonica]
MIIKVRRIIVRAEPRALAIARMCACAYCLVYALRLGTCWLWKQLRGTFNFLKALRLMRLDTQFIVNHIILHDILSRLKSCSPRCAYGCKNDVSIILLSNGRPRNGAHKLTSACSCGCRSFPKITLGLVVSAFFAFTLREQCILCKHTNLRARGELDTSSVMDIEKFISQKFHLNLVHNLVSPQFFSLSSNEDDNRYWYLPVDS